MIYAEILRDTDFEKREDGVSSIEEKLKTGYNAYKKFCHTIGCEPKDIIEFLNTKVI